MLSIDISCSRTPYALPPSRPTLSSTIYLPSTVAFTSSTPRFYKQSTTLSAVVVSWQLVAMDDGTIGIAASFGKQLGKALPPEHVWAELPLLNTNVVHEGRWVYPDEHGSDTVRTRVEIVDLALRSPPKLDEEGFEISHVAVGIKLPDPSEFQTSSPGVPWGDAPRPMKWFADQFSWRIAPLPIKSRPWNDEEHNLITLSCSGELLRGATSEGAAKTGKARWPPTFNTHVDQDLSGSPLTTYSPLLPFLFIRTPITLYNIWIALNDEQVRPLALRDRRYVKDGDLAAWQEITFDIPSDRFVATNSR